jgi:hypothetical protein
MKIEKIALYLFLIIFTGFILYKLYNYSSKQKTNNDIENDIENGIENNGIENNYKTTNNKHVVIVSITTSPRRIKLMKNTLDSILNQTYPPDLIRINIPKQFKRTGQTYEIPDFIQNNNKIQIFQYEEDYGPIMKLLPTLSDYSEHPNANIIYVDDDVLMLPHTIETFIKYININPNFVYCLSGFDFKGHQNWIRNNNVPCYVNIPEGYMSVCFSNSIINKITNQINYSIKDYYRFFSKNEYCFTSDDLMIGNFLAMNNIQIYKIHDDKANFNLWWKSGCELQYGKSGDGIMHLETDQHFTRYNKAFQYLIENNMNYFIC